MGVSEDGREDIGDKMITTRVKSRFDPSYSDPIKFEEIEGGYARQRALARLVVRTDDNRPQPQIISWEVKSSNRSTECT